MMQLVETQFDSVVPALPKVCGESRLAYRIANISFGLTSNHRLPIELDHSMLDFAINGSVLCDVDIQVSLVDSLRIPGEKHLFHSGGLWSLFAESGGYRLNFLRSFRGETPYKSAWFNEDFSQGELSLSRKFFAGDESVYPLEYPLDEVLMIHHLACGKGIELHGLGVLDVDGRGHLFLGHSGAGKSTSARLWQKQQGTHILSDDRIILRRENGKIWMHGTPWHGDAGIASPRAAQLSKVYILEQWPSNELVDMPRPLAAAEIFARCFVPRHCPQALNHALGFIDQLSLEIPCDTFRFLPQQSAVEAIRRA